MSSFLKSTVTLLASILVGAGLMYGFLHLIRDTNPPPAYAAKTIPSEPTIEGPPEFQADVQKALAFLKEKSPERYENVCLHTHSVKLVTEQVKPNAFAWTDITGTVYVNNSLYFRHFNDRSGNIMVAYPLPLTLVHETTHLVQLEQKRPWTGEAAEREALAAERDFLHALGMPPEIIDKIVTESRVYQ